MKKIVAISAFLMMCAFARSADGQIRSDITIPPNGGNQRAEVSQWVGLVKITIAYHSPRVHGGGGPDRNNHLWGEFIPYGMFDEGRGPAKATPWRAGANESTTVTFSHDVKVEGKDLKAGTYGVFLELQKDGPWIWIFSNNATGWGSYQYDPKNDALRVSVTPQAAAYTEFLTYGFDDRRPNSALAFLQWENKRVPFKIEVPNVNELYVDAMRKDLDGWAGFNYENWQRAAQFCANNKINLEEALVWADKAISEPFRGAVEGHADASTLGTKAAVLMALGRDAEAEAIMEKAIRMEGTPAFPVYQYGLRLLAAGKKEKALEVFKFNQQQHPDEKFFTSIGLARAYTALGDKKNAITSWEMVLKNVPDAQKTSIPAFESELKALKEGK